jgi:hypothetical protein
MKLGTNSMALEAIPTLYSLIYNYDCNQNGSYNNISVT